jgi:hypothetical protein
VSPGQGAFVKFAFAAIPALPAVPGISIDIARPVIAATGPVWAFFAPRKSQAGIDCMAMGSEQTPKAKGAGGSVACFFAI